MTVERTTTSAVQASSTPQDIDLIEVIDSEDEELEQVMDASFEPVISSTRTSSSADIKCLLETFQKKVNKFDKQEIIVYRNRVLESAFRALKRPHFDVNCKLYVKFSGEIGMDHGGPRREFFRLAIHELSKSGLFEGADHQKSFRHNHEALQEGRYRLAGILVAMSLAQDGPAMGFLNRDVFQIMMGLEPDLEDFDLQLIPDTDIRNILEQLKRVDSEDSRSDNFLSEHGDWMIDQGINNCWRLTVADIPKKIHVLVMQTIFYRTSSEIDQFAKGMDDVGGLTTEMKKNPYKWEDLFCKVGEALTKEKFLMECVVKWSAEGSNRRRREEDTNYAFELFLQDIEESAVPVTFGELLVFISGAEKIPPTGFGSSIEINFYDQEGSVRMPFSSTCALNISLPRGTEPDTLRDLLIRALKESMGFGKC